MDLSRPLVAAAEMPPAVEHAVLVAAVAVRQAGTRTARVAARLAAERAAPAPGSALAAVLLGGAPAAARLLGGSFHPRLAGSARAPGAVKPPFTLAF